MLQIVASLHSKVVSDFEERKGDQEKASPKFSNPKQAMEWLNGSAQGFSGPYNLPKVFKNHFIVFLN